MVIVNPFIIPRLLGGELVDLRDFVQRREASLRLILAIEFSADLDQLASFEACQGLLSRKDHASAERVHLAVDGNVAELPTSLGLRVFELASQHAIAFLKTILPSR